MLAPTASVMITFRSTLFAENESICVLPESSEAAVATGCWRSVVLLLAVKV